MKKMQSSYVFVAVAVAGAQQRKRCKMYVEITVSSSSSGWFQVIHIVDDASARRLVSTGELYTCTAYMYVCVCWRVCLSVSAYVFGWRVCRLLLLAFVIV